MRNFLFLFVFITYSIAISLCYKYKNNSQLLKSNKLNYHEYKLERILKSSKDLLNRKQREISSNPQSNPENWEKSPFILQTYNEPDEEKYYLLPILSNGYIGTVVKNSSIYLSGIYNGQGSLSHRARIPSMTAIKASIISYTTSEVKTYHFDCRKGVYFIETKSNEASMIQRFYVHRKLKNIIVNEIRVQTLKNNGIVLKFDNLTILELNSALTTADTNINRYSYYNLKDNPENMIFEHRVYRAPTFIKDKSLDLNDGIYYLQSNLPQPEIFGKRQRQIHTYYTNLPSNIATENTGIKHIHFIQSVDTDNFRARNAYEEALRMIQQDPTSLFNTHVSAWEDIWQKNGFVMLSESSYTESNQEALKLAQRLYVSFYNLYSALPTNLETQYYGLSPSGLGYGGVKQQYLNATSQSQQNRQIFEGFGGHLTYHQEFWILPLISMFNIDMSKSIINSRIRKNPNDEHLGLYEQARELATKEGKNGLKYPWEQADYGIEVSSLNDANKKIHVSADISFGLRSYLRMTHSQDFLYQSISSDVSLRGEDYIYQLAKYWSDKFVYEDGAGAYGIKGVSFGERQQSRDIDNEAFTNYMASLSLETYKYILLLTNRNPYDLQYLNNIKEFEERINKTKMPYDDIKGLYLEYDNYLSSHQNQETFVSFLNFPVQKNFSYIQKKSIYDNYGFQLTNEGRNLLSYASFIVGYIELNEEAKSKEYLQRFNSHFTGPFMVLSEYPQTSNVLNPNNNFNYLPGYAAFIQSFIGAYCGLRIRDFQLDLIYPSEHFSNYQTSMSQSQFPIFKQPTPNLETWNITGLLYLGNRLDIIYRLKSKSVEIRNRRTSEPGIVADNSLEVLVYEGTETTIKSLKIGDSITINIATDLWIYDDKLSRLQKNNYSENINILASIYSISKKDKIQRPSNANNNTINIFLVYFIILNSMSALVKLLFK